MFQESRNLNSDPILLFCQNFVSRNQIPWPPDEETLAAEFVSYFQSVNFLTMSELEQFCIATGIDLTKKSLPKDLLAFNCFPNGKRIIELDDHPENRLIQPHTILHEVRELLEYSFRDLDHPTVVDPEEIEMRADEFASLVMVFGGERIWTEWIVSALEIKSGWPRFGALVLIGIFVVSVVAQSYLGAIHPDYQDRQAENQQRQRYLT